MGGAAWAGRFAQAEKKVKAKLLDAVNGSLAGKPNPPFIPIALLANESVHDPITATRIGSYWNLIINYVIGSRMFPAGSEEDLWIPRYLETKGGLCMGMVRAGGAGPFTFWTGPDRINPLYGTRYVVDTLR